MKLIIDNCQKYKWFFTSSNKLVVGGKNALQNEELLHLIKREKKDFIVMHTSSPGSPFSIILDHKKANKDDIAEAAVFTACFSQAWKSGKKTANVDIFNASQLSKPKNAKIGTWQVKGFVETLIVPLELYLIKQKGVLRAVPEKAAGKPLLKILPGKILKEDLLAKIQLEAKGQLNANQLLSALPAGGIKIEKIRQ